MRGTTSRPAARYFLCVPLFVALAASSAIAQTSQWVFVGPDGRLAYKTLPQGDHIMDFSWAGYMGGGVSLPTVPVKGNLSPSGGDDTSAIQAAINAVAALTPDTNGFRGAVLLAPGTFNISATLNINTSGVVLRGSGSGNGGTITNMTGATGFLAISIQGSGSYSTSNTANFTDSYVPSGTSTINVSSAAGFSVGDNVLITRTVTAAWVHFMGMDTLVRGGVHQTWLAVGTRITTDRIITAISGNTITIDAPLTDSFDSTYLGTPAGTIAKYTFAGRISQDGLEHLKVLAPAGTTVYGAVTMNNIIDAWIQDVAGQETQNAFNVDKNAKRVTLDHVINNVSVTQTQSARTGDFSITGTGIFVNQCQSNGTGDWPLVTSSTGTGPIAILNFSSTENGGISPHQRWTTGILSDNGSLPNAPSGAPGIAYRDRGIDGSGHGWTSGWSVAWNVTTPDFLVQQPPGTENWCIGCIGTEVSASEPGGNGTLLPNGIFDSTGTLAAPSSLYLAQLCERLGAAALTNIGYNSSYCVDFSLSATPGSQTVTAGGGTSYTATVMPAQGFAGTVNLNVSGLPGGATGSFNPTTITGGSGSSTLTVTTLNSTAAGSYPLTVTGTSGGLSHSAPVTLVVNPSTAPTTTTVVSSANPSVFGQPVTFTATVSPGIATGTVTFKDGAATLGPGTLSSGTATFPASSLAVGAHSITAVYGGDSSFAGSIGSLPTQTVNKANTSATVSSSLNPSNSGQAVTFTATVTANAPGAGTPAGTVTFFDGASNIGSGALDLTGNAGFTTSILSAGVHSITAQYGGNGSFNGSTSAILMQTVNSVSGTDLAVLLAHQPAVSGFGGNLVFTATVVNYGQTPATAVILTESFTGKLQMVTAASSAGSCTITTQISCPLGTVSNGNNVTVAVTVVPLPLTRSVQATATVTPTDSNPGNNTANDRAVVRFRPLVN